MSSAERKQVGKYVLQSVSLVLKKKLSHDFAEQLSPDLYPQTAPFKSKRAWQKLAFSQSP